MNQPITRRSLLNHAACGFGSLALASMLGRDAVAALSPSGGPPLPHHAPRAKRVIFLFMQGGVSHVDSFDRKPKLDELDGQMLRFNDLRTVAKFEQHNTEQRIMKPMWRFSRHGQCGRWGTDLFPHINQHVDDLCFIHSMHTEGIAHGPATLFLHTGSTNFIRPSMGAWVSYGLGTENSNLPAFVTIAPSAGNGGARNYGAAFLPAAYQGTAIGKAGGRAEELVIRNLGSDQLTDAQAARQFNLLQQVNAEQLRRDPHDTNLEAVINSYELAWRMQNKAPDVLDLAGESKATLDLYGIGSEPTDVFGRQCLMARRMAESGVRFIQVTYGDNTANPSWDQHSKLERHADHAKAVDLPVAGLLTDLKQRGLLEDTLVWWGSEFGRTPYAERNGTGRDHNPAGFTVFLAGGGVKTGFAHGATDEFGHHAIDNKVHMHDLHATILHLLGLNHEKLTYRYAGRDFRLTDVYGNVIQNLIA